VWQGTADRAECDASPEIVDGTDALVWVVSRHEADLSGVVVDVGDQVCSFEVGDPVIVPSSAGEQCCSSSLWGLTEYEPRDRFGHLVRVPLAEFNLLLAHPSEAA
jgi:threonine dehydrogenase-like Zn-dependent dehydrogenase